MTSALLFGGQGEALAPILATWYPASSAVRALVDQAAELVGSPCHTLLSRGGRSLRHTSVYQPVATALCTGIVRELDAVGVPYEVVAGHSLGELSALSASGSLAPDRAVHLARHRGTFMAEATARNPGGMASVRLDSAAELDDLLEGLAVHGPVGVAAYNTRDRVTLTGSTAVMEALAARGVGAVRLSVEGPWHGPGMTDAVQPFHAAVEDSAPGPFERSMVFNHTGRVESDPRTVPDLLARQLVSPIRWLESLESLRDLGVTRAILAGPARAVRGFVRDVLGPTVATVVVETPDDLDRLP